MSLASIETYQLLFFLLSRPLSFLLSTPPTPSLPGLHLFDPPSVPKQPSFFFLSNIESGRGRGSEKWEELATVHILLLLHPVY